MRAGCRAATIRGSRRSSSRSCGTRRLKGATMAELSDQLLVITILAYLGAMLCYAVEYAFGSRGVVARVADREVVAAHAPAGGPASSGLTDADSEATGAGTEDGAAEARSSARAEASARI